MYILWIMLGYILLCIGYVMRGPSVWDRLLGLNLVSSKAIIIIIAYASFQNTTLLLDFALIYAIFGFVGTVFVSLFLSDLQRKKREGKEASLNGNK